MRASRWIADALGCRGPPQALVMHSLREIAAQIGAGNGASSRRESSPDASMRRPADPAVEDLPATSDS